MDPLTVLLIAAQRDDHARVRRALDGIRGKPFTLEIADTLAQGLARGVGFQKAALALPHEDQRLPRLAQTRIRRKNLLRPPGRDQPQGRILTARGYQAVGLRAATGTQSTLL